MKNSLAKKSPLLALANVGPATLRDLTLLGITTIEQLAICDPSDLYQRLEIITKQHHDPCVWDVFAAIVHEARTGKKVAWWFYTPERKSQRIIQKICAHQK